MVPHRSRPHLASIWLGLSLAIAACGGGRKFEVQKTLQVDSTTRSVSQAVLFDLAQVPEIAQVKDHVTAVRLDGTDAAIATLAATNTATAMSVSLRLRAEAAPTDGSQDVVLGELAGVPLISSVTATLPRSDAVDAFLLRMAQTEAGRFTALLTGTADGEPHFALQLKLRGTVSP